MTEVGLAVGITFVVIGSLMTLYGGIIWVTTKGFMYNTEDVDAMVAATVMEEDRQKKEEESLFDDFRPGEKSKKRKVLTA